MCIMIQWQSNLGNISVHKTKVEICAIEGVDKSY